MNNEKETINKEEAAATLESLASFKRDATKSFRMPLFLIMLISLSYSLIIFSYGMTEHENMWALGALIGGAAFFIFIAFSGCCLAFAITTTESAVFSSISFSIIVSISLTS